MNPLIIELNEHDFNERISSIFPFINNDMTSPHRKGKGIIIESMENILVKNNFKLNYLQVDDSFEDILSFDSNGGLEYIYNMFFENMTSSSDVLFFTPFFYTNNGSKGIVVNFNQLHCFLLDKSSRYYKNGLDASSNDLFFYLYEECKFFGIEHNSPPYWLSV
ncbi:hypothetical protein R6099_004547 [Salmonella enterica]|nr:hypothetical protein [Salmonella enterica]